MATYVIGDVQGCYEPLRRLLDRIAFEPGRDRVCFAGDLVNRGPGSLDVLRHVRDLGPSAVCVLGNHDVHLLACAAGHARPRGKDTLDALLEAPDAEELVDWVRRWPLLHREEGHVVVHAGLLPQWSIEIASMEAAALERCLGATQWTVALGELYGARHDRWSPDDPAADRLAAALNALTRIRVCRSDGSMDFRFKGAPEEAPDHLRPWFRMPRRRWDGTPVVFGHWAALGVTVEPHAIGVDGGCVWGGELAAFRLQDRAVFRVSAVPPG